MPFSDSGVRRRNRTGVLALLLIVISAGCPLLSQTTDTTSSNPVIRTSTLYTGFGFLEAMGVGYQFQVNEHFAIGPKLSLAFAQSGPIGIKASYFFDDDGAQHFLWTNVINLELTYGGMFATWTGLNGVETEVTVGHDAIVSDGLGMMFAVGAAFTASEAYHPIGFLALKLGLHFNRSTSNM